MFYLYTYISINMFIWFNIDRQSQINSWDNRPRNSGGESMFDRLEKNVPKPVPWHSSRTTNNKDKEKNVALRLLREDRELQDRKGNMELHEQYMYAKIKREKTKLALYEV